MRYPCKTVQLVAFIALLSAGPAFTQTPSPEINTNTTSAPSAYVYVQTSKGVNLYDAAANGQLTLVKGSPFKTVGLMIGSNGKHFITLGTDYIHSYAVAASGAIGEQASTIDTQDFAGNECGPTNGAALDHTGQNLYVRIGTGGPDESSGCFALQSYMIEKSSGAFSFLGVADNHDSDSYTQPTLAANDVLAHAVNFDAQTPPKVIGFKRGFNGGLDTLNIHVTEPTPEPGGWVYYPWLAVSDPTNHLAVAVFPQQMAPDGTMGPDQLASYTVASNGNVSSTNTWKNMPTPDICLDTLNMAPSGKFLAAASSVSICDNNSAGNTGLQIFHFNGANPLTPLGKAITTAPINSIRWDSNNHLYATSESSNKLYVYTVTSTTITEAPGSPYSISSPSSLVVVPK